MDGDVENTMLLYRNVFFGKQDLWKAPLFRVDYCHVRIWRGPSPHPTPFSYILFFFMLHQLSGRSTFLLRHVCFAGSVRDEHETRRVMSLAGVCVLANYPTALFILVHFGQDLWHKNTNNMCVFWAVGGRPV